MIAAILSILGSSAVGSILGGVFAFLNRKADIQVRALELDHETRRWAHDLQVKDKDLEYARLEAQGKKDVAIIEGEATIESSRFDAIAASQTADRVTADELKQAGKLRWLLVLSMAVNKWVRPLATTVIAGAAVYLNMLLIGKLVEAWPTIDTVRQYDAAMQAFAWITGQAGAVLGYWFVSRGSSK